MKQLSLLIRLAAGAIVASLFILPVQANALTVAGATNIAAAENGGRVVKYSSQALDENGKILPEWQVTNLIDGKHVIGSFTPADSYGWSSQNYPSEEQPEWVVLAFAGDRTHLIGRIVVDPTTDDPPFIGRWARDIQVEVSTTTPDGPYRTVRRLLVTNNSIPQAWDFGPVEARYVRLIITSNHGSDKCVEMGEVKIYEAITPDDKLDQLIVQLENLLTELKHYRDVQLYQQEQRTLEAATTPPAEASEPAGAGE